MKIGLTYDLRSEYRALGYGEEETAEFDRQDTIDALAASLSRLGHAVVRIGHVRELTRRLAAGERWDMVFNIAEGLRGFGREAQVPALLDAFDIPYTFSDPLVACVALHKEVTKRILVGAGLPTPASALVASEDNLARVTVPAPLFAKPVAEGTSKGCDVRSMVACVDDLGPVCRMLLERFRQPVLVETYLPGREFTVGVLGTGAAARPIGALEVVLLASADPGVYSYENKERSEERVEYRLATDALAAQAQALAVSAWRAIGARDAGRVDLRCDAAGRPQILEINPLPGLHPEHSDLPMLCTKVGMTYDELVGAIVASARERIEREHIHRAA